MSLKLFKLFLLGSIITIYTACSNVGMKQKSARFKKYVVNAYVGGFRGLLSVKDIDAGKLTHINYAFVNVKDSMAVLTNLETDTTNFRQLNTLKKINPDLKILISIGGWSWSENFSDAALTPSSRELFAKTSVDIVRKYKLDGVDIDWEYPGKPGEEGNIFRSEDMFNYTLTFRALRQELNKLERETGQQYQLTAAVGGSESFIKHTEMAQVQQYLDYIWLMTYDYSGPNGTVGHHTNLYPYNQKGSSADKTVQNFINAGVPAGKLVLGAAFYGKGWKTAGIENNGLSQKNLGRSLWSGGYGYTEIKDSLVNQKGYKRYWDKEAKAPYLFNPETKVFITYDDEQSIREKIKYVKKNNLAGIFFWEYFRDPKEYLLTTINQALDKVK